MSKFLYEIDDEKFEELRQDRFADNKDVVEFLSNLVADGDDRRFNFTILNLGELMKICAIELGLKNRADEISSHLYVKKEQVRDRRMNKIIKELNAKINIRFTFDEDTEIVPCLYTYKGVGYIYIDKITFCNKLNEIDIDIETLKNV